MLFVGGSKLLVGGVGVIGALLCVILGVGGICLERKSLKEKGDVHYE